MPRELTLGVFGTLAVEAAKTGGVAVGEIEGGLDPLPALFGLQRFGLSGQFFEHELFEQRRILQPSAIVLLEQVAHDDTAGCLIDADADIDGATVGGPHCRLSQHPPDIIGLLIMGP